MIATDKRKAAFLLHQEGMSAREIARRLSLNHSTVLAIIQQAGVLQRKVRSDKQQLNPELLRKLYHQCKGWIQRVYEKLVEEEGIQIQYSTLTRMLRELGISQPSEPRCARVPDEPGAEMQHDTSPYQVLLAGQRVKLVASLLYLRYSKRRYLQFYRSFDRFRMKCFLHEGLVYWGHAPRRCIIDNTNLARLRGSGKDAVLVPEMEAFAKQYGFEFNCHAIKHADRKAGEERSFWTVETNFFPGRTFQSLEDLNRQALQWSTVRMEHRPQGKARLIPAKAFEHECAYLAKLTSHLPAPYRIHGRGTDQYGYVAFDANYYWVPGTHRDDVTVLEYSQQLKIYRNRECVAEYPLPADGVKNKPFSPLGLPLPPHAPQNRKQDAHEEEKRLRALAPVLESYLDWVLQTPGLRRHEHLRKLLALSQKMSASLFIKSVERAHKYRITCLHTLERIARLYLHEGDACLPSAQVDQEFQQREAYQEGCLTEQPDLSIYDDPPEPQHE